MSSYFEYLNNSLEFLAHGGQAGAAIRSVNWNKTSLGSPEHWPQSLKNAIRLILDNGAPMYIAWGPDHTQFYNDGYLPILGRNKHPKAIGISTKETFSEIWATIGPMFQQVLQGESIFHEDLNLPLERNGKISDSYFTFSYSPLRDDHGNVAGVFVVAVETTSKKNALIESHLAQNLLYQQMMQAPVGIAVLEGPQHIYKLANPTYMQLLPGRKESDLLNRPITEALPEVVKQGFVDLLNRVYKTGAPFVGNEVFLQVSQNNEPDKHLFVDFIYQPAVDANGDIKGILVVASDVTEKVEARKTIENANKSIENERQNFRNLFKQTPEMVCILRGPDHVFEFVNEAHVRALNFDATGKTVREAQPESVEVHGILDAVYRTGKTAELFEIPITLGNRLRYFNLTYSARRDRHGTINGVMILGTEITDQILIRNSITSQKDALELTLRGAPTSEILELLSKMIEQQLGPDVVASTLLISQDGQHTFRGDVDSCGACWSNPILSSEKKVLGTFVIYYKHPHNPTPRDQEIVDLVTRTAALVIERRSTITDLEKAKRGAEMANEAKTRFLANVSHEIRTPLAAILGFSELMKEKINDTDSTAQLDRISRNAVQLGHLIDDLLDLSKIEAERFEIEPKDFELFAALEDALSSIQLKVREKGLSLRQTINGTVPQFINTDPVRFRQVLVNLLGNAVKFTESGNIDLQIEIKKQGQKNLLLVRVKDTGIGLSEDHQKRIFARFVQGDASVTRKYGGTGLGLILSRRLAQLMGGDLILEQSAEGEGSSFVFTLELRELSQPVRSSRALDSSAKPRNPKTRLAGMEFLVVDDSIDNQMISQLFIENAGGQVQIANNGLEAVNRLETEIFDAVLMDIQMPVMDGYQALKVAREKGYRKPIIALTAHALKEEKDACLAAGFTDYISKPIDRNALIQRLAELNTLPNSTL